MAFQLPELPFEKNALEPHISQETLEFHYGKHHKTYVDKLNALVDGTPMAQQSLEDVVRSSEAAFLTMQLRFGIIPFYWHCLAPKAGGEPTGKVAQAINSAFGSFENFKTKFTDSAVTNFGSGWTWLVKRADGSLDIVNTSNAATPLTDPSMQPILTVDVWEHAYYVDYRNARPKYMEAFWALVNWNFVEEQFSA